MKLRQRFDVLHHVAAAESLGQIAGRCVEYDGFDDRLLRIGHCCQLQGRIRLSDSESFFAGFGFEVDFEIFLLSITPPAG